MKTIIKRTLESLGYTLVRSKERQRLRILERLVSADVFRSLLVELPPEQISSITPYLELSKAQLAQDLFVLAELSAKKEGFFVEFGATDGITLSNSWLLENNLAWDGIVSEPARIWHEHLAANRKCIIDKRCVWKASGEMLRFFEVPATSGAELSSIKGMGVGEGDSPWNPGGLGKEYDVQTVSLTDLLEQHNAPPMIDFLSIDTEGSEFEILSSHDFNRYKFRVICVEHNFKPVRSNIFSLLVSHGYSRKYEFSSAWDDWYVLEQG